MVELLAVQVASYHRNVLFQVFTFRLRKRQGLKHALGNGFCPLPAIKYCHFDCSFCGTEKLSHSNCLQMLHSSGKVLQMVIFLT